ncbi:MAG: pyrroline-5-carboxylate reductase [Desulfobulbus oligotrophicus]|jgi:pyrroline-5-carboxylate reductase|nr:pyrroline-5-carboxylate reductase [Desulfobulbus oligotrophicus]
MSHSIPPLGCIGGGQMTEAFIRGLLTAQLLTPAQITVAEPDNSRCDYLTKTYGVQCTQDPGLLCSNSELLLVAVKPQVAIPVLEQYRPCIQQQHLVISIMAGISLASLTAVLSGPVRLIRVMPNIAVLVLAGASAYCANAEATDEDRQSAAAILSSVGTCTEVEEHLLDAVTGLSGSGPGYVLTFIEAMIDGGVLAGLPRSVAEQLALQTVYGSARLALTTGEHPAVLKAQVTSPGGTTISGVQVLEQGGLRGMVMAAIKTAAERSRELGA